MAKYVKYSCFALSVLLICFFVIPTKANVYHRVVTHVVSGYFPTIDQISDTKPYLVNGSLSSCPASSVMIAAYYGSLTKKLDDLSPSGYGYYLCKPYDMKGYTFSETSMDADDNLIAGAHGFLVKNKKCDPTAELPIAFLRAHSVLTLYYPYSEKDQKILDIIHQEIQKDHPIYMQYQNRNVVIIGYGTSSLEKDLLLIKDPSDNNKSFVYLNQAKPSYLILTQPISFNDTIQVVAENLEIQNLPSIAGVIQSTKKRNSVGVIKLHPDYNDLWINEWTEGTLSTWFFIQWEDGSKGWSKAGVDLVNYFEPYVKPIVNPEKEKSTVTIVVHEEELSGPIVKGAFVSVTDGKGKVYSQTTNNFGSATMTGDIGKWSFKITKTDFFDKNWKESIEKSITKDVFILKKQKKEEDKLKPNLICKEIRLKLGPAEEGKEYYINPAVMNTGKTPATVRSHVKILLSPRNDTNMKDDYVLGEAEVSTLKVQEICIATLHFYQFPSLPFNLGKEYQVWPIILVDSQNEVDESDENNMFKSNTPITIKRKPREGGKSPCDRPPCKPPALVSPVSIKVDGARVTFQWKEVECASFYDITIYTEEGDMLYYDGPIHSTAFTIEFPLDPKSKYWWCITPGNQYDWGPSSTRAWFETK